VQVSSNVPSYVLTFASSVYSLAPYYFKFFQPPPLTLDIIKEFVKCLMSERDSIREQERQIKLKIKKVKEEIKALKQQLVRPAKDVVRRIMGIR
jgi:hypothetical protein